MVVEGVQAMWFFFYTHHPCQKVHRTPFQWFGKVWPDQTQSMSDLIKIDGILTTCHSWRKCVVMNSWYVDETKWKFTSYIRRTKACGSFLFFFFLLANVNLTAWQIHTCVHASVHVSVHACMTVYLYMLAFTLANDCMC
jgi:hypothetical protein